jgi:hypothetical protein
MFGGENGAFAPASVIQADLSHYTDCFILASDDNTVIVIIRVLKAEFFVTSVLVRKCVGL